MKTLGNEVYAPITDAIGFLKAPLEVVVDTLVSWRIRLERQVELSEVDGALSSWESSLGPLESGPRSRELLIATKGDWIAWVSNSALGTNPFSAVEMLAKYSSSAAVMVSAKPHTLNSPKLKGVSAGRYGGCRFDYWAPGANGELEKLKHVMVAHSGGSKWLFFNQGEPQPFEEPEAYERPRVRERFTSEMLERYCQALGIDVFNEDFYGPRAVLVDSKVNDVPPTISRTLKETQEIMGIVPGRSAEFPG
ncbi:hypothetical protein [Psychromicrobium lacuslunae]|uniref:Uncharacterized protein n=1 Tax=Psychromicrobium lacuslunae TaxID=1618207 RepID=A0A0D4C247_9MICC|nr:hypothetical protein [Psychromicrobium lacuslunae]AJT42446.1 hypothetical protein UM93_14780 [Psychromicrobium lacuslunae]